VIEWGDQWAKVYVNGKTGYLYTDFLILNQENSSRSMNLSHSRLRDLSLSLVGIPYRLGGTSLHGFDCSGFTTYVMGQFGVKLPRISTDQFVVGTAVDRQDLQVGDLLFFDSLRRGKISHVGIYIGNNKMVHSATREVDVVDLDWYYKHYKYYGARRVVAH
jgi:peptidoglycan endopeptidase LytE